jgi:geranylgeranyl diphosphate synthase, type I
VHLFAAARLTFLSHFDLLIKQRSGEILEKFGQAIFSDVMDPHLKAALVDIKRYWSDLNRPSLTLFSCEAVGGTPEMAKDAALMFTLASCGFGVHDDIIDRSTYKHLRRTILGRHGPDVALLVGDLLIVKAWAIAHQLLRKSVNADKIANVMEVYGRLSVEICEAETMETTFRKALDTDLDFAKGVLWKEMAETEACCRVGAMLGNGQPAEVEALAGFGRRIGFISRLTNEVEDCLNLKVDLTHRILYESMPLPLLYAAKNPRLNKKISAIINKDALSPTDVELLLGACFESEAFQYVRCLAENCRAEATLKLRCLKDSEARNVLLYLVDGAYKRIDSLCV